MDIVLDFHWVKTYLLPIIDISIIAFVIYKIYVMISETRAIQVVKGLVLIILAAWLSRLLHLETVHWLLDQFMRVAVIGLIILFQPELRRMLTRLGQSRFIRVFLKEYTSIIDTISSSTEELSDKKIGALVAIESKVGLKNYIETGVCIDGLLSSELLFSIFRKESPLHDGASIIRRERIIATKCILPLTERHELLEGYGTRHLAALGLAEETDAFVLVVSDETGQISIAWNANLEMGVSIKRLKERLNEFYGKK